MDVVSNPTAWERFKARVRSRVIAFLQRRIDRRLAGLAA
jgi:indolepyruvate ferredoxin oxidoreductase alpha subunit